MRHLPVSSYKGFPNPSKVISVEEAAGVLEARNAVFVDTRNYWKYVTGHIPGAINLELYAFHWVDTSSEGLRAFTRQMTNLFGSFGIGNRKRVIFYENNSGYDAARGVWLMDYLGNKNAAILDGGLKLWKRKKLPMSTADPRIRPTRFKPSPDTAEIATLDSLLTVVKAKSDKRVLDTRSRGEYIGQFRRALKGGHVPRAVNVEWSRALRRDGSLKDARTLERIYARRGLARDGEVITYCQSGYRAAHSWLVLKLLGYRKVRNYIGSWYEWGSHQRTPIAKR
ncbi:MAG: sulfurtransferase [Thaumarchaeota archaeon]|nr:sulfurtransferase [Nitrososphaerota archaeon]